MKTTKIYKSEQLTPAEVSEICTALKEGATAILPTDTVYGLIVSTAAEGALEKLNEAKKNPSSKPPQILCSFKQAFLLAQASDAFIKAATLWPGALTLIAKSSDDGAKIMNGGPTVGIRVPDSKFIVDIVEASAAPLFASSANIHEQPVCEDEVSVLKSFDGIVDIIVLSGDIKTQSSCVIDLTGSDAKIIRRGLLEMDAIEKLLF